LLETANKDPDFPKKVITADESWVYGCDPETKAQSSQWNSPESPSPKKAWPSRSNAKAMLTFFFITKVLSATSTILQARQYLRGTTSKSFAGWGMQ